VVGFYAALRRDHRAVPLAEFVTAAYRFGWRFEWMLLAQQDFRCSRRGASLLAKKLSLFLNLGNLPPQYLDSPCVLAPKMTSRSAPFAKFPVKFPVRRKLLLETGSIGTVSPANPCGLLFLRAATREFGGI
jgi:hypothetical protein